MMLPNRSRPAGERRADLVVGASGTRIANDQPAEQTAIDVASDAANVIVKHPGGRSSRPSLRRHRSSSARAGFRRSAVRHGTERRMAMRHRNRSRSAARAGESCDNRRGRHCGHVYVVGRRAWRTAPRLERGGPMAAHCDRLRQSVRCWVLCSVGLGCGSRYSR
jgi:hypothetical protein